MRRSFSAVVVLALVGAFLAAGSTFAEAQYPGGFTQFGKNKVTYDTFDFWVYQAPHFDIYYYPEEEAHLNDVVAFSEHAYRNLSGILDHELSERTPIIYYQTHAEFQQTHVIPFFLPEGVAAFAEPTVRRLVLPVDDPPDELAKLINHEITHIFEYDYFYGSGVGRALQVQPPGWVMEGFAEYASDNLTSLDEMLLRDVVLSDNIPTLVQMTYNRGFLVDYVLGQVVFDFIEESWGLEGVRIFMAEIRRDLGQDIERDLERAFNITPQEFNSRFRDYLRDRYLPGMLDHVEAEDVAGQVFSGIPEEERTGAFSPVLSPDGGEFAALTVNTRQQTLDLARFDLSTGRKLANISDPTRGDYEYIIGQGLTVGFRAGNDLSWSPDGDRIAFFARTGPTRTLYLIDARNGRLIHKKRFDDLDQAMAPNIGPDGRVVFGAHQNGIPDIWIYDPRDGSLANLTQDDLYDYGPVWSPDGESIVFASHVLGVKKLFRVDLARPQGRQQLSFGQFNDTQPSFSRDGRTIYFSSDRTGKYNIYSLDLGSGMVAQLTDLLHGGFYPQSVPGQGQRILFSAYGEGEYDVFLLTTPQPVERFAATDMALSEEKVAELEQQMAELSTVELDAENVNRSPSGGWHIEDIIVAGGVTSRGTVLSNTGVVVTDLLGNHRITALFGSYSSQRNIAGSYQNLSRRLNWGVSGTSQRLFFFQFNPNNREFDREAFYELDGAELFAAYPLSQDVRVEFGVGFYDRQFNSNFLLQATSGEIATFQQRFSNGSYLPVRGSLIVDKARFKQWGPFRGRRVRFDATVAPGVGDLQYNDLQVDWREYLQVTDNSLFAVRYVGKFSTGDNPNVFFFGGLNQLRGFEFLQFSGSRATYLNLEYRFPLIYEIRGGELAIRHIRGVVFFDLGAAWFDDQDFRFIEGGVLQDAIASVGGGLSISLGPLPFHIYVSKPTNLEDFGGFEFDFYIGPSF